MIECLFKHAPVNYSEIFRNGGICGKKKINQRTSVPSVCLKGKSQGKSQRIHQRSDSHCTDRFYTWFYRGCVISRHLVEFLVGSVLVILGMIFFSMGAELSMTPMGEHVGGSMLL